MCPTPLGRIETRTAIIVGPAIIGLIVSLVTGHWDWLALIGVYLLMGLTLDALIYSPLIKWQPPWMTFVLAVVEYGILLVLSQILEFQNITVLWASVFYWGCWTVAIWSKLSVLPIINLTYIESAAEFRAPTWSIPPQQVALSPIASPAGQKAGPGKLIREASGAHAIPLERIAAPSGVRQRPPIPEKLA